MNALRAYGFLSLNSPSTFLLGEPNELPQQMPVWLLRSCTMTGRSPGMNGSAKSGRNAPAPFTSAFALLLVLPLTMTLRMPLLTPLVSLNLYPVLPLAFHLPPPAGISALPISEADGP